MKIEPKKYPVLKVLADLNEGCAKLRAAFGSPAVASFQTLIDKVLPLLGSVDLAVGGGVAVSVYTPPRATVDLDLFLVSFERKKFDVILRDAGFTGPDLIDYTKTPKVFIYKYKFEGSELDLIEIDNSRFMIFLMETATKANAQILGAPLKILSPEGLILTKLVSNRPKDYVDISSILDHTQVDLDVVCGWAQDLKIFDRIGKLERYLEEP